MSARAIKGGGGRAPARAKSNGGGNRRGVSTRRKAQPQGMFESLGLEPGTARRLLRWSFLALIIVTLTATVFAFRLPQLAGLAIGEGIGKLGFTLKHVETRGNHRVSTQAIYDIAFNQQSSAMPLVDLDETRERLLHLPWIREARVSRRLPDTIVVDVIERVPVAVWQQNGRFSLIDADGVVLEPVGAAMPELVRLIGPDANRRFAQLTALLEAAPRLRPMITDATWVGERRWDLHFQGGETLSLPEGDADARRALERFAQLDQRETLLGRGFARIDMRDPRRAYVRISREPGARVPDAAQTAPDPGQPPHDLSETI
ncbi:cell division protein FtsQ/DivIB [Allosphingosinicella sp.]|uniref:cell division protein FtsQ/DivIB n=1 Tax=Allosphingosinicella sp. TaxID=2823234 RepID=UPI003784E563